MSHATPEMLFAALEQLSIEGRVDDDGALGQVHDLVDQIRHIRGLCPERLRALGELRDDALPPNLRVGLDVGAPV